VKQRPLDIHIDRLVLRRAPGPTARTRSELEAHLATLLAQERGALASAGNNVDVADLDAAMPPRSSARSTEPVARAIHAALVGEATRR
jgi:hypothetical protein